MHGLGGVPSTLYYCVTAFGEYVKSNWKGKKPEDYTPEAILTTRAAGIILAGWEGTKSKVLDMYAGENMTTLEKSLYWGATNALNIPVTAAVNALKDNTSLLDEYHKAGGYVAMGKIFADSTIKTTIKAGIHGEGQEQFNKDIEELEKMFSK